MIEETNTGVPAAPSIPSDIYTPFDPTENDVETIPASEGDAADKTVKQPRLNAELDPDSPQAYDAPEYDPPQAHDDQANDPSQAHDDKANDPPQDDDDGPASPAPLPERRGMASDLRRYRKPARKSSIDSDS